MVESRLGPTRIRVSPLCGVLLTALLVLDDSTLPLLCLLAAALHECGHLLLLFAWKHPPAALTVGVCGLKIEKKANDPLSLRRCAAVSLAGPAVNLLCFTAMWLIGWRGALCRIHLIMGLLHLLPVEPLDGGQALSSILACHLYPPTVDKILTVTSLLTLIPLTVLGGCLLLYTGYNATLLALCLYLTLELLLCRRRTP